MRKGMTLMSVMVAVALAGIVALAMARLLGYQAKTMSVVRLREQRENLLKHYKNIVVSGWDATRGACSAEICARDGSEIIPAGGLYLAEDLYDYNHTGTNGRWWKVSVTKKPLSSGDILQADSYADPEALLAVEVKVEFIRQEHPVVNIRLAAREEVVFLHHNTSSASINSTQCESDHLTQVDSAGDDLYAGTGAIVQYDFHSNYTKCSQVPLVVDAKACDNDFEATLGFFRDPAQPQLITGKAICSIRNKSDSLAGIRGNTEKRTVEAIDCSGEGYVNKMEADEKPKCVDGPTRVAAESLSPPKDSRVYPTRCVDNSGWCGTTYPEDPTVHRAEGISYFKKGSLSGEAVHIKWGPDGPPGPPGPPGPRGCNVNCPVTCCWWR